METMYIDNRMGITAIKLLGALVDSLEAPESFVRKFNEIGFPGVRMERHSEGGNGIIGSKIIFIRLSSNGSLYDDELDDEDDIPQHHHTHLQTRKLEDITEIINDLPISGKIRKRAINIYNTVAEASAKVKKIQKNDVSLHRTGSKDVIASVVGVCMLLDDLDFEQIIASPIATGNGYAITSRGKMPIPIPALVNIIEEIPYSAGTEDGEICSLEGAAILKEYVDKFSDMPELVIIRSGAGFGTRDFKSGVNCTRVSIGKIVETSANATITELEAVILSYNDNELKLAGERLDKTGAIEAYTIPISKLGGGSAIVLKCICQNENADAVAGEILKNTSATSVRRHAIAAYNANVSIETKSTSLGDIGVRKVSGFGVAKSEPIPAELAELARKNNMSISEVYSIIGKEI